jgi:VWFA-related protein
MRRRTHEAALATLLIAVLAGSVAGQQVGPPFRGEAFVNTVEVPVRVLDRDGEPVTGLEEGDFEILEDGVLQPVTNFLEIRSFQRTEVVAKKGFRWTNIVPERRDVVYFFDLLLSVVQDKRLAVAGLREKYGAGVPEGERVSIVSFDGDLQPLVERSTSVPGLMEALNKVDKARSHGLMWSKNFVNPSDMVSGIQDPQMRAQARRGVARTSRRQYFGELRARVEQVGAGLSATLARFADTDARRVMVVFTPGLPRSDWTGLDGSWDAQVEEPEYVRQGLWQNTAMEAADLGFTMYFVDSSTARFYAETDIDKSPVIGSGLAGSGSGEQEVEAEGDEDSGMSFESTRRDLIANAAEVTGGRALHYSDVDQALVEVSDELGYYYSLAYTPEHAGDGEEHSITVRLPDHPEYRVEHRRAYVDRPLAQRDEQHLRAQMLFGSGTNPLGVRMVIGEATKHTKVGARGMKKVVVPIEIQMPHTYLELVQDGDVYGGMARIAFMVEDKAGNVSPVVTHQVVLSVTDEQIAETGPEGYFTFATDLETEGGKQTLYVAVTDLLTERTGMLTEKLDF